MVVEASSFGGVFSHHGFGPLVGIKENMNKELYLNIMQNIMLPYSEVNMSVKLINPKYSHPKPTTEVVTRWFSKKTITTDFSLLNPIENL